MHDADLRYRLYRLAHQAPVDALHRAALNLACSAVAPEGGPITVGQGRFEDLLRVLEERGR